MITTKRLSPEDFPLTLDVHLLSDDRSGELCGSVLGVAESLSREVGYLTDDVGRGVLGAPELGNTIDALDGSGTIYCMVVAMGRDFRDDVNVATLRVLLADRSGLPSFGERGDGLVDATFSPLAADPRTVDLVLREWVEGLRPPGAPVGEASLRRALEELIRVVHIHVLENQALLQRIDERDLVVEQLRGQVATLEAELRRKKLDPQRASAAAGTLRAILASVGMVAASFAGGYAGGMAAPPAEVQVIEVQQEQDLAAAIKACLEYERLSGDAEPPASG